MGARESTCTALSCARTDPSSCERAESEREGERKRDRQQRERTLVLDRLTPPVLGGSGSRPAYT